jgi:hypothetical protein
MTQEMWARMVKDNQARKKLHKYRLRKLTDQAEKYKTILSSQCISHEFRILAEHAYHNTLLDIDALKGDLPKWFGGNK